MRSTRVSAFALCCAILLAQTAQSQQYRIAPLRVEPPTLISQLIALRGSKPLLTPAEFSEAANMLLDRSGINFSVFLDSASCDLIAKAKSKQKDPKAPLDIGAKLKSVDAEGAFLVLPEPLYPFSPSCNCQIELPVLQMTDADFITVIRGRNIRFHLPTTFSTSEALLIDPKNESTVKKRWKIPFRATPVGVSHDENVVYLAFREVELADIALAVFGEGVFQITTKAEAEDGGKGKLSMISVTPDGENRVRFDRWGKSFIVSFKPPCAVPVHH